MGHSYHKIFRFSGIFRIYKINTVNLMESFFAYSKFIFNQLLIMTTLKHKLVELLMHQSRVKKEFSYYLHLIKKLLPLISAMSNRRRTHAKNELTIVTVDWELHWDFICTFVKLKFIVNEFRGNKKIIEILLGFIFIGYKLLIELLDRELKLIDWFYAYPA